MERSPEKRISLAELKDEEFFASIDWDQAAKKGLKPPIDVTNYQIDYRDQPENEGVFVCVSSLLTNDRSNK